MQAGWNEVIRGWYVDAKSGQVEAVVDRVYMHDTDGDGTLEEIKREQNARRPSTQEEMQSVVGKRAVDLALTNQSLEQQIAAERDAHAAECAAFKAELDQVKAVCQAAEQKAIISQSQASSLESQVERIAHAAQALFQAFKP